MLHVSLPFEEKMELLRYLLFQYTRYLDKQEERSSLVSLRAKDIRVFRARGEKDALGVAREERKVSRQETSL